MFEGIEDVIPIGGWLYAKTPEALQALLEKLRENYDIKEGGKGDPYLHTGFWSVRVREDVVVLQGKCESCQSYIDRRGIKTHKHKCEICGAYTYLKIVEGGEIRFEFKSPKRERQWASVLNMKIVEYDDETRCILLDAEPLDGGGLLDACAEEAKHILEENQDKFTILQKDGKDVISIRYEPDAIYVTPDDIISPFEVSGSKSNFRTVKLYQGQEYDNFQRIPIVEYYTINEAWHWAKLGFSPTLHEKILSAVGMPSDCGYYYQDGRTEFKKPHLDGMRLFVEHFTVLDLEEWDKMISRADRSGPGMIVAVAKFCHPCPKIRNEPNIGNLLCGMDKLMRGGCLTQGEGVAMRAVLEDPQQSGLARDFFEGVKVRLNIKNLFNDWKIIRSKWK